MKKVIVEALVGHKTGLDKAYTRYNEEELADFYKEIEELVSVYKHRENLKEKIDELHEKQEKKTQKVEALEEQLSQYQETVKQNKVLADSMLTVMRKQGKIPDDAKKALENISEEDVPKLKE